MSLKIREKSQAFNYVSTIWGYKIWSLEFGRGDKTNTPETKSNKQQYSVTC